MNRASHAVKEVGVGDCRPLGSMLIPCSLAGQGPRERQVAPSHPATTAGQPAAGGGGDTSFNWESPSDEPSSASIRTAQSLRIMDPARCAECARHTRIRGSHVGHPACPPLQPGPAKPSQSAEPGVKLGIGSARRPVLCEPVHAAGVIHGIRAGCTGANAVCRPHSSAPKQEHV